MHSDAISAAPMARVTGGELHLKYTPESGMLLAGSRSRASGYGVPGRLDVRGGGNDLCAPCDSWDVLQAVLAMCICYTPCAVRLCLPNVSIGVEPPRPTKFKSLLLVFAAATRARQ